jgi:hypothetical protein
VLEEGDDAKSNDLFAPPQRWSYIMNGLDVKEERGWRWLERLFQERGESDLFLFLVYVRSPKKQS